MIYCKSLIFFFVATVLFGLSHFSGVEAETTRYKLEPDMIASGVFVFWGKQESFSRENGANIVNTGFIVGRDAILAIYTGPTRLYAKEMIEAIKAVSPLPIRHAVVTHHHGDHAFGIQTFKKNNINILMHPKAKNLLAEEGAVLFGYLENLIGLDWTAGTEVDLPTSLLEKERMIDLGQRPVLIIPYEGGHTPGDLVIYDITSKTLFAGDLVFNGRAATIPHADISTWLDHLDTLEKQDWESLIPGHGPLLSKNQALDSTSTYLAFLRETAGAAISRGTTLAEIMTTVIPSPFDQLATVNSEFLRAMTTLFRQLEDEQFKSSPSTK